MTFSFDKTCHIIPENPRNILHKRQDKRSALLSLYTFSPLRKTFIHNELSLFFYFVFISLLLRSLHKKLLPRRVLHPYIPYMESLLRNIFFLLRVSSEF